MRSFFLSALSLSILSLSILSLGFISLMTASAIAHDDHECALDFKMKNIDGETVDLEDYEGSVVLVVNVASRCGNTKQYAGLQAMYEKYQAKGLVVIGFPCNQFGAQEAGSESDIKAFCTREYNVTFPMMSKVDVKGDSAAAFYKNLTSVKLDPVGDGKVTWNFEKFVIDREGQPVARFSPKTQPSDEALVKVIEAELAK